MPATSSILGTVSGVGSYMSVTFPSASAMMLPLLVLLSLQTLVRLVLASEMRTVSSTLAGSAWSTSRR